MSKPVHFCAGLKGFRHKTILNQCHGPQFVVANPSGSSGLKKICTVDGEMSQLFVILH